MSAEDTKWQPVMIVAPNRLECNECGSLAIFIVLDELEEMTDPPHKDYRHTFWCQACFRKAQEEEE